MCENCENPNDKKVCNPNSKVWHAPESAWNIKHKSFWTELFGSFHDGGHYELRTKKGKHGNQCWYDSDGALIDDIPTAGSADKASPAGDAFWEHQTVDVRPFKIARKLGLGCVKKYYEVRPVNGGKPCKDYGKLTFTRIKIKQFDQPSRANDTMRGAWR